MDDMPEIASAESDAFDRMADAFAQFTRAVEESDPKIKAMSNHLKHMIGRALEDMSLRERDFYTGLTERGLQALDAIVEAKRLAKLYPFD